MKYFFFPAFVIICLFSTFTIYKHLNKEPTDWENMGKVKSTRLLTPAYGPYFIEIDTDKGSFRVPTHGSGPYIPNGVTIFWSKESDNYKFNN